MSRPILTVWIPSNRKYKSKSNLGKPAPMDGLNELIGSNRAARQMGARRERENVKWCAEHIARAMQEQGYRPMTKDDRAQCMVVMVVSEPSDRRDVSNVIGGVSKYVLDALTARHKGGAGAIWDDSVKWLRKFTPSVTVGPNPGVRITVYPLEDLDA